MTTSRGTFVVAGPQARAVLAKLTETSLANADFPWLTGQVIEVGYAVDVYALRVNFIGELGWELHFPIEYANGLFEAIFAAGREFGIGMVGMRAMESLRLEKSYRMWGSDLTPDYTPFEAGLERFVRMGKGEFIGRDALARQQAAGIPTRFVTLEVHGVTDADPLGNEPLFAGERAGRAGDRGLLRARARQEPGACLRRRAARARPARRWRSRSSASAGRPRYCAIRRGIPTTPACVPEIGVEKRGQIVVSDPTSDPTFLDPNFRGCRGRR